MINNNERSFSALMAESIAPILLSASVVSSAAYIYACGTASAVILFTVLSVLYSGLLFALYEKLRTMHKNLISTAVVTLLFVLATVLGWRLAEAPSTNELALWFMEPSRYTRIYYGNTYSLILILGFILISCLYYFTRIRYRGVFVFLICLCPFCLFAKTFTDIPVIYPIVIMTLFFFIMIDHAENDGKPGIDRSVLNTALAFVLGVTVIASFFPKLEKAPYRENFDEFITGVSIGTPGKADYTDFSTSSSNAAGDDDDSVVFTFYGNNPVYVKRQCFNTYDGEKNEWGYFGDANNGYGNWPNRIVPFEDPEELYKATGFGDETVEEKGCWVQSASGSVRALYTPDNIKSMELYNSDQTIYRTAFDEYFLSRRSEETVGSYTVKWSEFDINTEFSKKFTDELAQEISADETSSARGSATCYLRAKAEATAYDETLLSDSMMNGCYSSFDRRQEVRRLAERITDGLDNNFDKANAITEFFKKGDYIYDKEFTTPDSSPDGFIFDTKRGACAAYATAMTLMCRELGMTARYCEGFLVSSVSEDGGYYYVTAADSHAFVQVWIDGYGWTTFDPTSTTKDNGYFDMTFIYVGAAALLAVIIGSLVIFLRPKLEEAGFVGRMKKAKGAAQYSMIYRRINDKLNTYLRSKENTLTPTETAQKCSELFGCDTGEFVRIYEKAVYGGAEDEKRDMSYVYRDYISAYKRKLREERKQKRKWRSSARMK